MTSFERPGGTSGSYGYPLYKLKLLVTFGKRNHSEGSENFDNSDDLASNENPVYNSIKTVASEADTRNVFVAWGTNSGHLFLRRISKDSDVPYVGCLPCPKKTSLPLIGVTFNETIDSVLCLFSDGSLNLVSINRLMGQCYLKASRNLPDKSQQSASVLLGSKSLFEYTSTNYLSAGNNNLVKTSSSDGKALVGSGSDLLFPRQKLNDWTCCILWKTWEGRGEEWAICGGCLGQTGVLLFFNISTKEELLIRIGKGIVESLQLVVDAGRTYRYLLLHMGKNIGYFKLLLEQWDDNQEYDSVLTCNASTGSVNAAFFHPEYLSRFPPGSTINVSRSFHGSRVSVLDASTFRVQVFDSALSKFPLFVYQMPPNTIFFHVSSKLTFAVENLPVDYSESNVSALSSSVGSFEISNVNSAKIRVVSNLLACSSANSKWLVKNRTSTVLQEFIILPGERFRGVLISSLKDNSTGENTGESFDNLKNFDVFLWTDKGIYSLVPKTNPEDIFLNLVDEGREKTDAENLGKTLGLDLFGLFEAAADAQFDEGNFGRSLELYSLSNVDSFKIVERFLGIHRMDVVMSHLNNILRQPESLAVSERQKLSNMLLRCYLQCHLTDPFSKSPSSGFVDFVGINWDYDVGTALVLCLNYGLIEHFLMIACSRQLVQRALDMLQFRNIPLSLSHVNFLIKKGFAEYLKGQNGFLESLPAETMAGLIISKPQSFQKLGYLLWQALPKLSVDTLFSVAAFLDPLGPVAIQIDQPQRSRNVSEVEPTDNHVSQEECVEIFLASLFFICKHTKREVESSSKKLDEKPNTDLDTVDLDVEDSARDYETNEKIPLPKVETIRSVLETRKAFQISCGVQHTLILLDISEVYSWGSNAHGCLGLGTTTTCLRPRSISTFHGAGVHLVAAGSDFSVVVGSAGCVWAWGRNSYGQLGLGHCETQTSPQPIKTFVEPPGHIVQVSCGYDHTLFLDSKGVAYACGRNTTGQLGLNSRMNSPQPQIVVGIRGARLKGVRIACGRSHSCLVTENGDMFSWGSGEFGQLGHGDFEDRLIPTVLGNLHGRRVRYCGAGCYHTLAITDLGNIYSWGLNKSNQLGYSVNPSPSPHDSPSPHLIQNLLNKGVSCVAGGSNFTMAVTDKGDLYSWGVGQNGELGQRSVKSCALPHNLSAFTEEDKGEKIVMNTVDCGENFTVGISKDGRLFSWGLGINGQLGHGTTTDKSEPCELQPIREKVNYRLLESWRSGSESTRGISMILESSLVEQFHNYRPQVIIDLAKDLDNWGACAIVYKQMKYWFLALDCYLRALDMDFQNDQEQIDSSFLIEKVLRLAREFSPYFEDDIQILRLIFSFWEDHSLPRGQLHEFILDNIDAVSIPLGHLLSTGNNETGIDATCLTTELLLFLIHHYFDLMKNREIEKNQVSEERLWTCIFDNLKKDLTRRTKLNITSLDIRGKNKSFDQSSIPKKTYECDIVAFTCGHHFQRYDFSSQILPKFQKLSSTFQIPVSISMIMEEYKRDTMILSCPVCLYNNHLRLLHSERGNVRGSKLEMWKL